MKKIVLIIAIVAGAFTAMAQDTLYIYNTSNYIQARSTSKIDSITFTSNQDSMSVYQPNDTLSYSVSSVDSLSFIKPEGTVTDIDGNVYHTITIGTQTWMVENLAVTHYKDGTSIPNVTGTSAWAALTTGAYCSYNNADSNATKYGMLYNWYAVNTGNLAPSGWHVPTDAEWTTLNTYVSSNYGTTGFVAKEIATTTDWSTSTEPDAIGNDLTANNSTGFSALPGGGRGNSFYSAGNSALFWTVIIYPTNPAYARSKMLNYESANLSSNINYLYYGFSVRCVKD